MVVIDRYRYGCAAAKDRGTCHSQVRVARTVAEGALLAGVREQLLSESAFRDFQKAAAAHLKAQAPSIETAKRRLAEAQRWRENVMQAIRQGIITPTTKADLQAAEAAVMAAEREQVQPVRLLPNARSLWDRMLANLADQRHARDTLRTIIGEAVVRTENGAPVAEIAPCQIALVAGAGSVRYLHESLRIPLGRE